MASRPMGMVLAALLATAVSAGCGSQDGSAPSQQRDRASSPDAPDTGGYGSGTAPGEAADDPAAGASEATPGDVIDEALADGRPKVQAVTEDQLADVDWAGLVAACGS